MKGWQKTLNQILRPIDWILSNGWPIVSLLGILAFVGTIVYGAMLLSERLGPEELSEDCLQVYSVPNPFAIAASIILEEAAATGAPIPEIESATYYYDTAEGNLTMIVELSNGVDFVGRFLCVREDGSYEMETGVIEGGLDG